MNQSSWGSLFPPFTSAVGMSSVLDNRTSSGIHCGDAKGQILILILSDTVSDEAVCALMGKLSSNF